MRLDSYVGATSDNLNLFSGFKLSDGQREAVVVASQAPILILTGGPGCGKTYATAAIVKLWLALRREVKLAAPTGNPPPPFCTATHTGHNAAPSVPSLSLCMYDLQRLLMPKGWLELLHLKVWFVSD